MMKSKAAVCVFGVLTAMFLSGCRSGCPAREMAIGLDLSPSKEVVISGVHAYPDGGRTVITGRIKRTPDNCCRMVGGHIDINVVTPEDIILDGVTVYHKPRNIPKDPGRSSQFTVSLPYALPEDTTLRVIYHEDAEMAASQENPFICGHHQKG